MEQILDQIPKPLLVALIFVLGVVGIIYFNPQYTACHAQVEIFRESLKGDIFQINGRRTHPSKLTGQVLQCKRSNSPGGCFEMIQTLRKMVREVRAFPDSCSKDLGEVSEVRGALTEGLALLTQIAWGDHPPENAEKRAGWLESADVALFCDLRRVYVGLYGEEEFQSLRSGVLASLPGEEALFEKGECVNCKFRKNALQALTPAEALKRSLFAASCRLF